MAYNATLFITGEKGVITHLLLMNRHFSPILVITPAGDYSGVRSAYQSGITPTGNDQSAFAGEPYILISHII